MRYEIFIGLRYLKSRNKKSFVSIIGFISIIGVIIGVMSLNVVLAVMKGFADELRDKILGVNAHVVVLNYNGAFEDYDEIAKKVSEFKGVTGASPFVYGQGMLVAGSNVTGAVVRGIKPESAGSVINIYEAVGKGSNFERKKTTLKELKELGKQLLSGLDEKTTSGYPPIIIGKELAASLGVIIGDEVNLVSPFGKIGPLGHIPKVRKFEVIAIFDYGMLEYDSSISYVSIGDAMKFFDMKNKVSGIELKSENPYEAKSLASELKHYLGFPFYTRNWEDVNKSLFKALKLERIAIGIFLTFIILVAALDIISTLTMVVMEKNRDIAILKAMGANRNSILNIFLTEGMIIGVAGTAVGTALGYLICYFLKTSRFVQSLIPFDPQVYYVSGFPVKIEPIYFIGVAATSLIICLLATLYPSFQASRKDPVEALRYE
ncbi:MAG: FtsX-like permease family protein [Candidatus Dadabacteria bacterium]|nr:FtsX-like permease family protein [Candidatus Dadabacteria bacterium]